MQKQDRWFSLAIAAAADPAAAAAVSGNAWVRIADMALLYVLLAWA